MARKKSVKKNTTKTPPSNSKSTTKKKATVKKVKSPSAITKVINDGRTPKIVGLTLVVVAVFCLASGVSHLFFHDFDAALLESSSDLTSNETRHQFKNYLGKIGALTGKSLIYNGLGLATFIPFLLILVSGIKILKNKLAINLKRWWFKGVFLTIWLAIALSVPFLNSATAHDGSEVILDKMNLGGGVGYGLSLFLKNSIGTLGSVLILLGSLFAFLIVAYDGFLDNVLSRLNLSALQSKTTDTNEGVLEENVKPERRTKNAEVKPAEDAEEEAAPVLTSKPEKAENVLDSLVDAISSDEINEVELQQDLDSHFTEVTPGLTEETLEESEMQVEVAVEKEEIILSEDQIDEKIQEFGEYDPKLDLSRYELPNIDLLSEHGTGQVQINKEELEANKNKIVETLNNYKIEISKIKATVGPTVTLYEIIPAPGVRISKIKNLEDDIALSLSALGIRIIAPIPGKGTIGIEVPNSNPQIVSMKKLIASDKFQNSKMELPVALGKTISNETLVADLAKMPHLLMAGATGQGKSVGLNAILVSLLYKKHPAQIKFVLVDPKKVELTLFNKIERHYLAKLPDEEEAIITDTSKVVKTLNSLCVEMDARYELLKNAMVRNIKEYNVKFIQRKLNPENGHKYMPYIILVVDEFADLIMTAGKEVETPIARLAQLARAIGIHLIIATQRPSVNIITGTIKANFPARIAFRVTSKIDSRTILDAGGADQLIGRGDMLFSTGSDLTRLQCGFVDTPEVDDICDFIGSQQGYPDAFILPEFIDENASEIGNIAAEDRDKLFDEAARMIVMHQQGSTSLIQRKLKLGYNRAGRIIDQLEAAGIVGPFEGSKARKVLVPDEHSLEQLLNNE